MLRVDADQQGIEFARTFLGHTLPHTNWLRMDSWRWNTFNTSLHHSLDSQIVDLLMPMRDEAYMIDDVFRMVRAAELRVLQLIQPAIYRPESYVRDPVVLSRVPQDKPTRARFAELYAGNIYHHFLFVGKEMNGGRVARGPVELTDENIRDAVPVPHIFDPLELSDALRTWNTTYLPWTHRNLQFRLPLLPDSWRIVRAIDGVRTLGEIHHMLMTEYGTCDNVTQINDAFQEFVSGPFRVVFDALNGINKLYLTYTHTPVIFSGTYDGMASSAGVPSNPYHTPAPCKRVGNKKLI